MKFVNPLVFLLGLMAAAGAPISLHAQQDAYHCVRVVWKSAYNADFVYDTCNQALNVAFATPQNSGLVASTPDNPAIVYEKPGTPYKYWACTNGQPLDNSTQLTPTYNSTSVSCK